MNIFAVHENPVIAAKSLCDKHVVKMALETAQILSTIMGGPYKPTHVNHPCVVWARSSLSNFIWLREHGLELCTEYRGRYGKTHKCESIISLLYSDMIDLGLQPFVLCMPEEFKVADEVESYRSYYHSKAHFATWKQNKPDWWRL